jgi:predicted Zn-dependent peptidase
MPTLESFTLGLFLPVGSAFESPDVNGISHFIEHMLFKGTKKRSARQIVKTVERVGGLINASTGREITYFYIRIASHRLDLALDVLTDLVFNPEFDAGALEREKGVILEEMHMNEDDPGQALYERFIKAVHGKSGYARPILGTEKTITSFNRNTLRNYHKTHYAPGQLIASIAGGIDPDVVRSHLEKKISARRKASKNGIKLPPKPKFRSEISVHSKDVEQAALILGFPSGSIVSSDRYAFTLLDAILAGGMMSRLFQEVREKRGLVYSIDSTHQPYRKSGIFTVEAGMREENLITVLKIALKEISKLARTGPGKRELADTKEYLKGHWALGLESTSSRMVRNAMSTLYFDRLLEHHEILDRLDAVTPEHVAAAAAKCFENGGPSVGALSRFDNGNRVAQVTGKIREICARAQDSNGG